VADDNLTPSASVSGCRFSPRNSLIDVRKTISDRKLYREMPDIDLEVIQKGCCTVA
jgi:hypothetical protein